MATEVERLVATLEANIKGFERSLDKATGGFEKRAREIERRNALMARKLKQDLSTAAESAGSGFRALMGGAQAAIAAIGGSAVIGQIGRATSAYQAMQNQLKVAGLEGDALTQAFGQLQGIASRHGTDIQSITGLYSRLSISSRELGVSQSQLMQFVDGIGLALRVSGTSAEAARDSLFQLAQAIAGGKIQAEEFNSILDGTPEIARAVANGLTEAGGSIGKLRALVNDGKVSSRAFFEAFLAGLSGLQQQASRTEATAGQAFSRFANELTVLTGEADKATGVSKSLGDALNTTAAFLATYRAEIVSTIQGISSAVTTAANALNVYQTALNVAKRAREALGLSVAQEPLTPTRLPSTIVEPPQVAPRTVSVTQFPVTAAGGGSPGGARGGGGGGSQITQLQQETKSLLDKIRALELEAQTIGKTAQETAYLTARTELLQAAQQDGKPITDAQRAAIEELAAKYATATARVDDLQAAQENLKERMKAVNDAFQEFGSMAADAFYDLAIEGKSFNAVLSDMIKNLAKMLLTAAFTGQGPLGSLLGMGGGLSGALGSLFTPRATGGPVAPGQSYLVGERGPEIFRSNRSGWIDPSGELNAGSMGARTMVGGTTDPGSYGQNLSVNYSPTINAPGAGNEVIPAIRSIMDDQYRRMRAEVVPIVREAQRRRAL